MSPSDMAIGEVRSSEGYGPVPLISLRISG
jgi:hypothetical protein